MRRTGEKRQWPDYGFETPCSVAVAFGICTCGSWLRLGPRSARQLCCSMNMGRVREKRLWSDYGVEALCSIAVAFGFYTWGGRLWLGPRIAHPFTCGISMGRVRENRLRSDYGVDTLCSAAVAFGFYTWAASCGWGPGLLTRLSAVATLHPNTDSPPIKFHMNIGIAVCRNISTVRLWWWVRVWV